jgi:hypothetical protein
MQDFTWEQVQKLLRMEVAKCAVGYVTNLQRVASEIIENLDECSFECSGDTNCADDPEWKDSPSKWCEACVSKAAREKLRNALDWVPEERERR